jgi:hypothetical protein
MNQLNLLFIRKNSRELLITSTLFRYLVTLTSLVALQRDEHLRQKYFFGYAGRDALRCYGMVYVYETASKAG